MSNPESQHEFHPAGEQSDAAATDLALELDGLRSELQDANERVLRSQAEFENFRKRVQREMADDRKYAALPIVRDMLAVADNLELAIQAAEKDAAASSLLDGVRMVVGQFNAVLAQHQCSKIEGVGRPFDPNLHEALAQEPSAEHPAGTVTRVIRYGYQLHDRVVRPTQVFVSSGPPAA
jgi:molecular chaperone GrpE